MELYRPAAHYDQATHRKGHIVTPGIDQRFDWLHYHSIAFCGLCDLRGAYLSGGLVSLHLPKNCIVSPGFFGGRHQVEILPPDYRSMAGRYVHW